MEVVILAAGSGQRMGPLTKNKHKALLPAGQTTVLNRLLHQLHENSFNDIIIVVGHSKEQVINEVQSKPIHGQKVQFIYNSKYAEDTNIYSMKLALENINESFYLFEADILMSDDTIKEILSKKWQQQSTWFTSGPFEPEMKGGVLKESSGQVIDIDIVPQFISGTHEEYRKLTGAMFVHSKQTLTFRSLLKRSITKGLKQYYLTAWYENLDELPCHNGDLSSFKIYSFNTPEDYYSAHEDILGKVETGFSLVPVSELKPIEDFDENRARWLETEIRKQGYWTAPLVIDKQDYLILDGHHRHFVAKQLGLKKVPCKIVDYNEVKIWSLREDEFVNHEVVRKRALSKDIYPKKTVKHELNFTSICEIPLKNLTNEF